ncbi:hypothetical protein TorRG33x02_195530 [Trema orientale]|uniref:Uncharacterized protein n=1 Tax=Trema orientale TaxID=63057 RepID=A0A2P5EGK0_TREOI|nr:hypothetical protein TorRG33x02_195530 [Trema orientale]
MKDWGQEGTSSAALVSARGIVTSPLLLNRTKIDDQRVSEAQKVIKNQRDKQRSGNMLVLQVSAKKFNEQSDFLLIANPANTYQPTPAVLIPPWAYANWALAQNARPSL